MKKTKLVGLSILAMLTLGACGKKATAENGQKTIGVLQLVQHDSLDASYQGFKEGLAENGYHEGKNLVIDYQNAQNNQDNLKSMSEKLVKDAPDLLLGIATPAAQSLLNETTTIPITVTAVTDLKAANLIQSEKKPGGNLTGTSDMVPIHQQIALLRSLTPDAKTIGIMYNNGEANSQIQADLAEKELKKTGVKVKKLTANSTNDVQQVTTSMTKDVDGIYIPTDNTFASAAGIIGEIAKETKTPIVAGASAQVKEGGLATVGIDYHQLGKQTGEMAAKILDGKASPESLPVETAKNLTLTVNKDMAQALGIDPSSIHMPKE